MMANYLLKERDTNEDSHSEAAGSWVQRFVRLCFDISPCLLSLLIVVHMTRCGSGLSNVAVLERAETQK